MKKLGIIILLLISTLIVTGCGGRRVTLEPIRFDTFTIGIPEGFESVPVGLVENKQIINKVISAYRINEPTGFDQNIVISRSIIRPGLSFDDFATANTQRMLRELVGFVPGKKEIITLSCDNQSDGTLQGILHSFVVEDTFFGQSPEYYIHQFQFVTEESGYIISFATDQQRQENLFKTIVKSLECSEG